MIGTLVLKLGGELLESPDDRARVAAAVSAFAETRPLVIVHGGGRAIDEAMAGRGLTPAKVDGLRVTDEATLDVVVSVLAGSTNTELVAALVHAGTAAVGLTGADAGFGRAVRARAHVTTAGQSVDLGLVGDPGETDVTILELLLVHGYVPVVASLGLERTARGETVPPSLLNVNADVMACRIAAAIGAAELVIAGTTPGVLDQAGSTIPSLDPDAIETLMADRIVTAGMIAKLSACRTALEEDVPGVRLVDGRDLAGATTVESLGGTTLVRREPVLEGA